MSILRTRELKKYYGEGENLTKALDGVDIAIEKGEFTAIVGTSGSGKSTLLNLMGGLDTPTAGSVEVEGVELSRLSADRLTVFRRQQIGFVFQNYNLVPILNVYENIILPIRLDGAKVDTRHVETILSLLHLENKADSLPNTLSGGQQQRVALARALAAKPSIILADEPTGNLDSRTSGEVMGLLQRSGKQFAQTIVLITHNDELAQMADHIIRIEDGKVRQPVQQYRRIVNGGWI
ncbi:MAG TPA: ABC transporter ATP-binding protein [Clostridiales bacterium]|nr:ABC transporter ATP-binding protein [Clostridiales bacterium]